MVVYNTMLFQWPLLALVDVILIPFLYTSSVKILQIFSITISMIYPIENKFLLFIMTVLHGIYEFPCHHILSSSKCNSYSSNELN